MNLSALISVLVVGAQPVAGASTTVPAATEGMTFEQIATSLFVFLLSTFLGLEVIRRVSPLLHTPLMSLTNAISAIAVVAAIQVMAMANSATATFLCTVAIVAATTNIVGGFMITDRMLKMFKREPKRRE